MPMSTAVEVSGKLSREEEWSRGLLSHRRVMWNFLVAMDVIAPGANVQLQGWHSFPNHLGHDPPQEPPGNPLPRHLQDKIWIIASPSGKPLKVILVQVHEVPGMHLETSLFQNICLLRQQMEEAGLVRRDGRSLAIRPLLVIVGSETSTWNIRLPQFEAGGEISTWHGIKTLQVSHYRQGDIPAENLMSSLVSWEQCRNRLREGTGKRVLAQMRQFTQRLDHQVGNDAELAARLKHWMWAGLGDRVMGLGVELSALGKNNGFQEMVSLFQILEQGREDRFREICGSGPRASQSKSTKQL